MQQKEFVSADCQLTESSAVESEAVEPASVVAEIAAAHAAEPKAVEIPVAAQSEGCPPPLAWQQVLEKFRKDATPWKVDRGRYEIRGRAWGSGPPLYFLNGMGGTHEQFSLIAYLLRDSFRCVLYDYPGIDRPVRRLSRVALSDLAHDLFAIADEQGDRSFAVYATSFGSLVALAALSATGDSLSSENQSSTGVRISRAILQGGFARRELSWAERALIRLCRPLPFRLGHVPGRELVQRHNHRLWFPPFDLTRWQFFLENCAQVPVSAICHRAGLIRDADLRPQLPSIRQPVLLIHGEGDGLVSNRCQEVLQQGLPDVRDEILSNTGHIPYLTHPHRVAKLVTPFLNESTALNGGLRLG